MCGIAGVLNWDAAPQQEIVMRMTDRLIHRGPDGGGIGSLGPCVFGHRRLSILDLSDAGRQPMYDSSGRYLITFNGEVYNYLEVKRELERCGVIFRSRTDTEVILESYKAWGPSCVARFNGMFAFALWDDQTGTLLLARDRLGKKPLFYRLLSNGSLCFASELGALLEHPGVSRRVCSKALVQYLSIGYVLSSACIVAGVEKLPPASVMVLRRGETPNRHRYWNLAAAFMNKVQYRDYDEAAQQFLALFEDSVRIRLISDVPLGAFLSGGLDSSAVVAAMQRVRTAGTTVTFSTGFSERSFNELEFADEVASHLGVMHRSETVVDNAASILPRLAGQMCEPFADTSLIPMYLLARHARKHVTVALSGDGADEILAGYDTYVADRLRRFTSLLPACFVDATQRTYTALRARDFGKVSTDFKIIQFLKGCAYGAARAHYSWRELFTDEEKRQLLRRDLQDVLATAHPANEFEQFDSELQEAHYLDRAMYVDIHTWLPDDILVKVDRTTMAASLEARAPFLDYRVVELAASLPVELKLRGLRGKYLLRRSQASYLPQRTLSRAKRGFNAPVSHWLFSSLRPVCEAMLRESWLFDYVEPAYVRRLIDDHTGRRADNSFKLFALLSAHLWYESKIQGTVVERAA
jgi:asparagine synthase (glutamine-hydrolysing)